MRFLFLPAEHDPDSFVREHGAEAFERCVEQAVPLSRQLIEAAREGCDTSTAEGRARLLANAKPLWSALPEGILKMQLLAELAQTAGLGSADLERLWQAQAAPARRERPREPERDHGHDGIPDFDYDGPPPEDHAGAFYEPYEGEAPSPAPMAPAQRGAGGGGGSANRAGGGRGGGVGFTRAPPPAPRAPAPRPTPPSPADTAVRLLLLHSDWWERLEADDHELLHGLPEPHGPLCAWLERYLHEHGASPWSVLERALQGTDWAALSPRLVPPGSEEDELKPTDLRRVLDGIWVKTLQQQQALLVRQAASDPSALQKWREVDAHLRRRQQSLLLPSLT